VQKRYVPVDTLNLATFIENPIVTTDSSSAVPAVSSMLKSQQKPHNVNTRCRTGIKRALSNSTVKADEPVAKKQNQAKRGYFFIIVYLLCKYNNNRR